MSGVDALSPLRCVGTVLPTLKPRPASESEVMTPQVGSSVTLGCEARGIPEPEVTWYRSGLQLAPSNGLKMDPHRLEISGVQVHTHLPTHTHTHTDRQAQVRCLDVFRWLMEESTHARCPTWRARWTGPSY